MELTLFQTMIGGLSAVFIGIAKTGIAGFGIVVVPLMADAFGAKASVGMVLPMLIAADVMAISYYRRFARWPIIGRVLPFALVGIGAGFLLLGAVDDVLLKRTLGGLVIVLIGFRYTNRRLTGVGKNMLLAAVLGILAGIATIMANAAGPLMTVYLLWMGTRKEEFIGTAAWFFFIVNCIKVPFLLDLGLITATTLKLNTMATPLIVAGGIVGILIVKSINQKWFDAAVQLLAGAAAVRLIVS